MFIGQCGEDGGESGEDVVNGEWVIPVRGKRLQRLPGSFLCG
jgi:hypothetical protein